jgi:taurine dioxygenase
MSNTAFSVVPLSVGAEVVGLAPGAEQDPVARRALYDAWLEHGVLLFRGVGSIARHLAISRCFGELEIHPVPEVRHPENPWLIELGGPKRTAAYVFDGTDLRVNRIAWHRDTAYSPDICKGAMLRMLEVPVHEGETMLADTAKAWDDLPAELQRRLAGLEYKATLRTEPLTLGTRPGTFWTSVRLATQEEDPEGASRRARDGGIDHRYPSVVHPAVLTHPESQRRCIFLSPTYVDAFLGLDAAESDALLRALVAHMLQPKYVYRHKWAADDAIIWDNRRFMHAGMGNRPDEPRYAHRTTLAGPLRTGRYFEPEAQAPARGLAD